MPKRRRAQERDGRRSVHGMHRHVSRLGRFILSQMDTVCLVPRTHLLASHAAEHCRHDRPPRRCAFPTPLVFRRVELDRDFAAQIHFHPIAFVNSGMLRKRSGNVHSPLQLSWWTRGLPLLKPFCNSYPATRSRIEVLEQRLSDQGMAQK